MSASKSVAEAVSHDGASRLRRDIEYYLMKHFVNVIGQ
jgi:hypothetical protein